MLERREAFVLGGLNRLNPEAWRTAVAIRSGASARRGA